MAGQDRLDMLDDAIGSLQHGQMATVGNLDDVAVFRLEEMVKTSEVLHILWLHHCIFLPSNEVNRLL